MQKRIRGDAPVLSMQLAAVWKGPKFQQGGIIAGTVGRKLQSKNAQQRKNKSDCPWSSCHCPFVLLILPNEKEISHGRVSSQVCLRLSREGAVDFIDWLDGFAFASWLAAPSRRVSPRFETRTKRQTTVW